MINLSSDNSYKLQTYTVNHYRDEIGMFLMEGENIRYAFSDDSIKVYISDKRILIEESGERTGYTFIGLKTIKYLQVETSEVSRRVSGVDVIFGLQNDKELKITIEDESNPIALQGLLASGIFC